MSIQDSMKAFTRVWWIPMVTGLICIGLGVWTFCSPGSSIEFMAYFFAGCLIATGCFNIGFAFSGLPNWGWSLALGILEALAGVWLFCLPEAQLAVYFLIIVGVWILISAINGLCEACFMASYFRAWTFWLVLLVIATGVLAVFLLSNPVVGMLTVWIYLGVSLICYGVFRISLALAIRQAGNRLSSMI